MSANANNRIDDAASDLLEAAKAGLVALKTASRQLTEDHKMVLMGRAWGWNSINKLEAAISKTEGRSEVYDAIFAPLEAKASNEAASRVDHA